MPYSRRQVDFFLTPGQLTVQSRPMAIKTIVGSCVAVCLWDPALQVGGVNHYLLPCPNPGDVPDGRFGTTATTQLIEKMSRAGAAPRRLHAAVIGGGHPVSSIKTTAVGDDNVSVALAMLRRYGIRVVRQQTGGCHGRKLLFYTQTGELIVRDLRGWGAQQGEELRA